VTACDLEQCFSFDKTVEITSHVRFPIHGKHIVDNTRYIFGGMGIINLLDSTRDFQGHPRSPILAPFDRPQNMIDASQPIAKNWRGDWLRRRPLYLCQFMQVDEIQRKLFFIFCANIPLFQKHL